MGYFDPEPKRRREDFFNAEGEIEEFKRGLLVSKLVVVSGLRRYGKTSLMLTALNEMGVDYVFVDCRLLPSEMISINDVLSLFERELSRKSWFRSIAASIEGVEVGALGVRFRRRDFSTLVSALEKLEGKVLVFDEVQELRRSKHRFNSLIAYLYDHVDVKVVVSGSQVGLMHRFLRFDDPSAPLYGRPSYVVRLKPLTKEHAREFLLKGFEQEGVEPPVELIEEALELFDGVIGWLTYLGYSYTKLGMSDLSSLLETAARLAYEELNHALQIFNVGRLRYEAALRIVAEGSSSWSEVARYVESKLGRIPRNTLSNILKNLIDMGLVEKSEGMYRIADPVLQHAIRRYL